MQNSPRAAYKNFWAGLITELIENTTTNPDEIIRQHCEPYIDQRAVTNRLIAHLHDAPGLH